MLSVGLHGVSKVCPRSRMSAIGGENGLTVLAAPNKFLKSVMRRSEVAVGKCVGRQDLRRKRGTNVI